ncbi:MAG: WYL domain-containing protein [Muribaculaceae bacterium]|nr:WYL domain-containing protein [Muribaculaceae bacterium]
MATSVRLIRRYVWLIETIRRAGKITLEEINNKWKHSLLQNGEEEGLPERTFHRHREAIDDIFGIRIVCDRSNGNVYYIENEEELLKPSFSSSLFNGLAIDNQLMDNRKVSKRIMFEEVPGGAQFLPPLIEAVSKSSSVKIEYRSYNNPELKQFTVEPYGLKQTGKRWYLISHIPEYETLTIFALDRIESIVITEEKYEYDKGWDINSYFDEVVGVNLEADYDCEEVRIRVYGHQRHYIESLPLHKSQKLIKREKEYSEYSFKLRPEYEFQHEILKMGFNAEVLSPRWLRDEIRWQAQEILKLYQKE